MFLFWWARPLVLKNWGNKWGNKQERWKVYTFNKTILSKNKMLANMKKRKSIWGQNHKTRGNKGWVGQNLRNFVREASKESRIGNWQRENTYSIKSQLSSETLQKNHKKKTNKTWEKCTTRNAPKLWHHKKRLCSSHLDKTDASRTSLG